MFLVIPAVDLKDGKCIQLRQGKEEDVILEFDDPVEAALNWERLGAPRLHVVDLDGAIGGKRINQGILREIVERVEIPVQFGGGIRSQEDVDTLMELGVSRVIIGTLAFEDPEALVEISEKHGRDRVTVALDSREGRVVIRGWKKSAGVAASEAVKKFESYASEVLYTDVDVEGLMKGVAGEKAREVVEATSMGVIVSGGVTTVDDVKKIRELGAKGVVIGSAIYTGKLDYRNALRAGRGE
jgi:phosphoribosylformimino-5-aminoimidazole carboxamide ribotide isomerase